MRAVLIVNRAEADPGLVGHELRRLGYSFTELIREDWETWPLVEDVSLVVAMGSAWSTYWQDVADPVKAEQTLMAQAIARQIPIFGICFGAQQLVTVLGGTVQTARIGEIGWKMVEKVPETADITPDWLISGPWLQWHEDSFSVPPGTTLLADSKAGPQIIVSNGCLGVQFHPEATESIVRMWSQGAGVEELAHHHLTPEQILNDTRQNIDDAHIRCAQLVEWFVENIVTHKGT